MSGFPSTCLGITAGLSLLAAARAASPRPPGGAPGAAARPPLHWSFRPVRSPAPPIVKDQVWVRSPVDAFVLAKLEQRGLKPAAPASREALIRRATFDLTGLPPTPDEVDAFLADSAPGAFARVVDRLLASPAYGQRWGRHWLDAVRYADARDLIQLPAESDFREAWRYRDWVVDSFNRDLPYSDFIARQIAGDLLQPTSPEQIDVDALVATGMLAIADFVPGDTDKTRMVADYVDDQIDVVGRAVMGLTLACARCHDHKFDPISTKDYYALAGIFFSSRLIPGPVPGNTPLVRVPLVPKAALQRSAAQAAADRSRIAALELELSGAADRQYRARLGLHVRTETARYLQAAARYHRQHGKEFASSLPAFAQTEGLSERFLTGWMDLLGLRDYPLLTHRTPAFTNSDALRVWAGAGPLPWIAVNTGTEPASHEGVHLPSGAVAVSPSSVSGATAAWHSPVTGVVELTLRVTGSTAAAARALDYALELRTAAGRTALRAGHVTPPGSTTVAVNLPLQVHVGDVVELSVLPGQAGAALIEWTLRDTGGSRTWSLARDLAESPPQLASAGNGPPQPWRLGETGNVRRAWSDPANGSEALAGVRGALETAAGRAATSELEVATRELERSLAEVGSPARSSGTDATAGERGILHRLVAGDPGVRLDRAGRVSAWPDLTGGTAVTPNGVAGPLLGQAVVGGRVRPVLRFTGNELLQSPGRAPTAGTLFVVYRAAPGGASGQRLVGWEDANAGRHGVGLMLNPDGGVHAILRRDGASGDLIDPRPAPEGFEVICLSWGEGGTLLHRDGRVAGRSNAISGISSDPAITGLRIGAPGSGGAARFRGDLAEVRVYSRQLDEKARAAVEGELRKDWFVSERTRGASPEPAAALYRELTSPRSPFWLPEPEQLALLSAGFAEAQEERRRELETLRKRAQTKIEVPQAVVIQEGGPPDTPFAGIRDAHIFLRGNPETKGARVPRGFPEVLAGSRSESITRGSGRLELARWLTQGAGHAAMHPLTARVMVNRIWQHHFGEGIVRTSMNFGLLGDPPTHPELLDWLATRFVSGGWSMKALHRLIMLSSTYQQSAAPPAATLSADPENRLFGRMGRRRLEAEAIRDAMLAVAGRLDVAPGGPAFSDPALPRRTLYLMSVRTGGTTGALRSLLDAGDCTAIVERRPVSTVAPQALFYMNDPFVWEQSRALAARIAREVPTEGSGARIRRLHRLLFGRPPTARELKAGLDLLARDGVTRGLDRYCHVLLCTNEFLHVD